MPSNSLPVLAPAGALARHGSFGRLAGEAALSLYAGLGRIAEPGVASAFARLERRGSPKAARWAERLGHASAPRPAGPLVWVHAASVGETLTALPLINRLAERGPALLLTTGTRTSAEVAAARLPGGAIHQLLPLDSPGAVSRFLDHWRPDLAVFTESEFWPTILRALKARGVPLVVASARLSERSFRSWRALAPFARTLVGCVDQFLAQSPADAERLRGVGAADVLVCGNLKFDAPALPADPETLDLLRRDTQGRAVLLAASTHPGEEAIVLAAHGGIARAGASPLTVIAPRHPERGEHLAREAAALGLRVARRSAGEPIVPATEIYIADTIGEMGIWYRLADVAFLGGSLVPRGGQNPIEPAKLGIPVLHGPHLANFHAVYAALAAARAVVVVHDAASLAAAAGRLVADASERERLAAAAATCVAQFTGALERTLEALDPYLAAIRAPDAAAQRA